MMEPRVVELHQLTRESVARVVRSLGACTTVALIVQGRLTTGAIENVAHSVSGLAPRFVAVWGPAAEALHDAIDRASHTMNPGREPITVFDQESSLEEFLWHISFPYKRLDDSSGEICTGVVCHGLDDSLRAKIEEWVHNG